MVFAEGGQGGVRVGGVHFYLVDGWDNAGFACEELLELGRESGCW